MSIKIMSTIFEVKGQLSPTEKLVLLELADHANDQGDGIWPGADTIISRTSLKETAVRETLARLTHLGLLQTVEQHTATTSTRRKINVWLLEELRQAGEEGRLHPRVAALRTEEKAREEARRAQKQTAEGVSPNGTVSPDDTGCTVSRTSPVSPNGTGVPPGGPESLIKHNLNIQETEEDAGEKHIPPGQAWETILGQLRPEMRRPDYDSWVAPLKPIGLSGQTFRVGAPNSYGRDWAASRLSSRINRLLAGLYQQPVTVSFELACAT